MADIALGPRPRFVQVGHVQESGDWAMANHTHLDSHELIVVLRGGIEARIGNQVVQAQQSEVLLYPCGQPHEERSIGTGPLETIFIAWVSPPGLGVGEWPLASQDQDGRIQMLARWIEELCPPQTEDVLTLLDALLEGIVHEYRRNLLSERGSLDLRVKRYLQQHLAEDVSLDSLAHAMGMSKFHFAREFKALTGVAPMSYLREMRVYAAQALLLRASLSLKSLAPKVGFADEYQLSRVFRKVTGQSPGQFRRQKFHHTQPSVEDASL